MIVQKKDFQKLTSLEYIPVNAIGGPIWGIDVSEVPEHAFGLRVNEEKLRIGAEHSEYKWFTFSEAYSALEWQSNKNALAELDRFLKENSKDA